jgi:hypothetical protein
MRIRIQGFDHKQIVKLYIFSSKFAIFVILGSPSYRGSLQPSKENIRQETSLFSISVGHFFVPSIRIRIQPTKTNADLSYPNPQN